MSFTSASARADVAALWKGRKAFPMRECRARRYDNNNDNSNRIPTAWGFLRDARYSISRLYRSVFQRGQIPRWGNFKLGASGCSSRFLDTARYPFSSRSVPFEYSLSIQRVVISIGIDYLMDKFPRERPGIVGSPCRVSSRIAISSSVDRRAISREDRTRGRQRQTFLGKLF